MSTKNISIFIGSLRKKSFSKNIAKYIESQSSAAFRYKIIDIGQLPLYNQDFDDEGQVPDVYIPFREEIKKSDAFLFVTPEYNRSVPAVLKNALDVGSRPHGHNAWQGKPGGIISCSPGNIGAFGANHHLRQSLVFLNVLTLMQPEAYVSHVADCVNADGDITSDKLKAMLKTFLKAFESWVLKIG